MKKEETPRLLFEVSWEVCNPVGGIYTVLSTHARELWKIYGDSLCFIGPDIHAIYCPDKEEDLFTEEAGPLSDWCRQAREKEGLPVRLGRWAIPGRPQAVLVDFRPYYPEQNRIFSDFWQWFGVDSLHAYGDYAESCVFAYACGRVIESLWRFCTAREPQTQTIAHFHEWTTGMGLLYVKHFLPAVATVFTTHATSIGRSLCSNHKALYQYLDQYDGDIMAGELNMQSKHSLEKTAAWQADCFTTVSDITARECRALLGKAPDMVTPNGFEDRFVPARAAAGKIRTRARRKLLSVAEALFGYALPADTLLVATAGRYEFRNKGLDLFIESLHHLSRTAAEDDRPILAYILVPGNVSAPRREVTDRLAALEQGQTVSSLPGPIYHPYNTHWMYDIEQDQVLNAVKYWQLGNTESEKVKVVFVPCYLHGHDGIFDMTYYDLLQGFDLTTFLSYYEPWGYTPLESIAFSIPTMTTTLSGFGSWYLGLGHEPEDLSGGVAVIERSDGNEAHVVETAARLMRDCNRLAPAERQQVRLQARKVSRQALWPHFIKYYEKTYRMALKKVAAGK